MPVYEVAILSQFKITYLAEAETAEEAAALVTELDNSGADIAEVNQVHISALPFSSRELSQDEVDHVMSQSFHRHLGDSLILRKEDKNGGSDDEETLEDSL